MPLCLSFLFAETNQVSLRLFKERVNEIKKAYKTASNVKEKVDDVNKVLDDFLQLVETDNSMKIKVITITNYIFITNYVAEEDSSGIDESDNDRPKTRKHRDNKKHSGDKQEGPETMSPESFAILIATVDKAVYREDKKSRVRNAAAGNYFTIDQIIQLAKKLDWDEDKVEVMKYTYPNAVDKNNSFKLYDVIKSEFSKKDLTEIIENNR